MRRAVLDAVIAARAAKRPVAVVTALEGGRQAIVYMDETSGELALDAATVEAARAAIRDDRSTMIETDAGRLFLQVLNPPLRMIVVGAVHIAQALVPMAALAGYEVAVVDPRRAFATDARFPRTTVLTDWPDEALAALAPDRRTAVVTLTHDPKLDDPALDVALRSDAFYIASLGSRRTHKARLERLAARGLDAAALARIHGPAGLALGAKSPAEIALSILAQATATLHRADGA